MLIDDTRYQTLVGIRKTSFAAMLFYGTGIALAIVLDKTVVSTAFIAVALGASSARYRTASRLLSQRGLN